MDAELERRWREEEVPFNGQTVAFASEDLTPLPMLRHALLVIVPLLQREWPDAHLLKLYDWHEHDGFGTNSELSTWSEISALIASDNSLLGASHGDWAVRRAFFPTTYDFYLRLYIPADYDNDYPEPRGDFDLTCQPTLATEVALAATSASGSPVIAHDAKHFFDSGYSG